MLQAALSSAGRANLLIHEAISMCRLRKHDFAVKEYYYGKDKIKN